MTRHWALRTDQSRRPFLWSELQAGRLRQRWGLGAQPIPDGQGPPRGLNGSPWPEWYVLGDDGKYHYRRDLDPKWHRRRSWGGAVLVVIDCRRHQPRNSAARSV